MPLFALTDYILEVYIMKKADQARMAIKSRKEAETNIEKEVEISSEDTVHKILEPGVLLGYIWKNRTDLSSKEKILFKHTLPIKENKDLIIEEGINSFSLYGDENFTCDQVSIFLDYFATRLKKWGCFKPESYNDEFNYFFFKECIIRNLPVAVSIFNADQKKQFEVIKDVLNDIDVECGSDGMNNLTKTYIESYVYNWKKNLKAIA